MTEPLPQDIAMAIIAWTFSQGYSKDGSHEDIRGVELSAMIPGRIDIVKAGLDKDNKFSMTFRLTDKKEGRIAEYDADVWVSITGMRVPDVKDSPSSNTIVQHESQSTIKKEKVENESV